MHPLLLGAICAFVSFVSLLLLLWLCQRFGVIRRRFGLTRTRNKTTSKTIMLPDLNYSARQEYVQPQFEGSLCSTPHIRLAVSSYSPSEGEDTDPDSDVAQVAQYMYSTGTGVDPNELRGRLRNLTSPVSSGLLEFDLSYNKDMKQLCGVIVQARELPMIQDRLPSTFAEVELLPGHQYSYQTKIKHETCNPAYDECFHFGPIDLDQWQLISCGKLQFRIYHTEYLRKDVCIAYVDVHLADFSVNDLSEGDIRICRAMIKPYAKTVHERVSSSLSRSSSVETPMRYTSLPQTSGEIPIIPQRSPQLFLTKSSGSVLNLKVENVRCGAVSDSEIVMGLSHSKSLETNLGTLGMLQFSLRYTRVSSQLLVIILKVKDLQHQVNMQLPNVSVKLHIYNIIEQQRHSKRATVKRRGTDLVFNQSFLLHLQESALAHSQLVLTVIDSFGTRRSNYQVIGSVVLGSDANGEKECQHWLDAIKPDGDGQQFTMWHSIRLV